MAGVKPVDRCCGWRERERQVVILEEGCKFSVCRAEEEENAGRSGAERSESRNVRADDSGAPVRTSVFGGI